MERIISLLIGYVFGMFLTAEVVVKVKTGKRPKDMGSGNPGMANTMRCLGFKSGIVVLAGDLLKTVIACLIVSLLFERSIGKICILYAGIGAMFGHNYPAWNKFVGGKGVAVTCMFSVLFDPLWGLISCIAGAIVVGLTRNLAIGGIVIPFVYVFPVWYLYGAEAGILALVSLVIMALRHRKGILKKRK